MSGGSYNYLCYAEADDLLNRVSDLESMAARLAGLGYAKDAASETEELLCVIRQAMTRIEVRAKRLREVWRAVEWWDSCDSGEEEVKKALAEYRKELEGAARGGSREEGGGE